MPMTDQEQFPQVTQNAYIKILRDVVTLRMIIGTVAVVILGLAVIAASYLPVFDPPDRSWLTFGVRQIGSGLLVVAIVNVVLQVFVERHRQQLSGGLENFIKKDVNRDLQEIRTNIEDQAQVLLAGSATLAALGTCGVSRVYASRSEAVEAIKRDVEAAKVQQIRIMGISLNDFLRADQRDNLHSVWRVVTSYINGARTVVHNLDIKVLIIDPRGFGALVRSYGETQEPAQLAGRLDKDVEAAAEALRELVAAARARASSDGVGPVTFDFRLYRLAPTTFMCCTDTVSYVQPYYFWPRRQFDVTMPLLRLEGTSLHKAMTDHFDRIWHTASVDGAAWADANEVGVDKGALEAGTVNVFTPRGQGYNRMCWLIKNARERVWLQGISLKSFFEYGQLYAAVRSALDKGVDLRILLLDPYSEQARCRSYREHGFAGHCERGYDSYQDYKKADPCHVESTLVHDINFTINRVRRSLPAKVANSTRLYSSAPSCFVLIVDDEVLVEQYHYGKATPPEFRPQDGAAPPILGKDMPLVEYSKNLSAVVTPDDSRHPHDLLMDHFNFVYEHCSVPLNGNVSGDDPSVPRTLTSPTTPSSN
jgi:hypothetical protein